MKVLSTEQRAFYKEQGYLVLPGYLSAAWLARLNDVTDAFIAASSELQESNRVFDLEPSHRAENPRIRRLISPVDQHQLYWQLATCADLLDPVEDLIGSDIKFHHGKLNFKFPHGGEEVKWHQDIQFWPHTNYDLLTVGIYLNDVAPGQGEMGFVPRSHDLPLFDLYDGDTWTGHIQEADLADLDTGSAVYPTGPAGTVTIHNCRMVHGSAPNQSAHSRPLLLQTYAPADALPTTDLVNRTPHGNRLVRAAPQSGQGMTHGLA